MSGVVDGRVRLKATSRRTPGETTGRPFERPVQWPNPYSKVRFIESLLDCTLRAAIMDAWEDLHRSTIV